MISSFETVQTVPLRLTEDGTIRVADSRVSLESVVHQFKQGATPEQIAQMFPAIKLADIYSVIAYYLNNRDTIDAYLAKQEAEADTIQQQLESATGYQQRVAEIRNRLLARRSH
jgi:uncharacterized protein (DUF433 family)